MFLLIAYKRDGVETSMGVNMGSYSSQLITTVCPDEESLIREWRNILTLNQNRERQEPEFNIQIYENGKLVWDQIEDYGFVELFDTKLVDYDLTVAADYLEERGFAIAGEFLRNAGKGMAGEDCDLAYDKAHAKWYGIRDKLLCGIPAVLAVQGTLTGVNYES